MEVMEAEEQAGFMTDQERPQVAEVKSRRKVVSLNRSTTIIYICLRFGELSSFVFLLAHF
jgi:hypothetical protein